jgi:hypothetical protein
MKNYYYSDGLTTHGPVSLEELRAKKLSRNAMVRLESSEKWLPAEQFPELEGSFEEESFAATPTYSRENSNVPMPRTWFVESILVTIFCCLPFGIAGIVHAARVETKYNCGDIAGAKRSSEEAGKWTQIGFWIAVAGLVIYLAFIAVVVAFDHY